MGSRSAGAALGFVNILLKNAVNLAYTPVLLRFAGQGDYGVYQMASSFVFSLSLLSFGLSGAYLRFYNQRRNEGGEPGTRALNGMYLLLYLGVSTAVIVVGLLLSANAEVALSGSFTDEEIRLAAIMMAIMTVNVSTTLFSTVFDAYILAHERFQFQQSRQIGATLAGPILSSMLLVCGAGVVGVATAQLAVSLGLLVLNARYAISRLSMRFEVHGLDRSLLRSIIAFSGWIFLNQICDLTIQSVPNVILGAASGPSAVAIFAVALQLRSIFYALSMIMSSVFAPLVNRMVAASAGNQELTGVMARVGRYQSMLLCFVYGGFVLLGQRFVQIWAGAAYADAYWLTIAMVAPLFVPLSQNVGIEIQKAKNLHKARSIVYLVSAIIGVALSAALAPSIGYWGPVVGFAVYLVPGSWVFMNYYYQRRIGLDMGYFWKRNVPVLLCSALVAGVCVLGSVALPVAGLVSFLAWGAAYSALFGAVAWFVLLSREEKDRVVAILRRSKGDR